MMTARLPSSPAPVSAIPALVRGLTTESTDLARLSKALDGISRQAVQDTTYVPPLGPLKIILALSERQPESLATKLLLSCIIAYPLHRRAISALLSRSLSPDRIEEFRGEVLPSLVTRLQLSRSINDITRVVRILLLIVRAHEELLGLVLEEATFLLPALRTAYQALAANKTADDGLQGKADALMICHELVSAVHGQGESKEALKRLMGGSEEGSSKVASLGSSNLRADYEGLLERGVMLDESSRMRLQSMRDEQAAVDPRVTIVHNLFPHLPAHTILTALSHTYFTPHPPTLDPEAAAAPLIDALLSGQETIPEDLVELRRAMASHQEPVSVPVAPVAGSSGLSGVAQPYERRNIWDGQKMDISRLKIADDFSDLPAMGETIPDHLRDSIMRLVESQAEEEAEQEKALREVHGFIGLAIAQNVESGDEDEESEGGGKLKIGGDGEESGEEESGDKVVPRKAANGQTYDVDQQTKLELAYLSNPSVFDRDAQTRRSDARKKLKELTKMDDAQLEGWRVMLDRNPHKEAILSRHTFAPTKDYLGSVMTGGKSNAHANGQGEGRGGGRGKGRGGRGGGPGGHGGQGGAKSDQGSTAGSSRGGGGSRGRGQNKSSRGHSNAARTRGHDKKMARMGAGV